ncbi:lipopolysaccharide kinase InaA family protein [Vreelandella azerica]|uniref:lipopolysaccharide kinase InaA family protein n=1 Tax=Vreelandella azerica TaxID=2732867 RepID=UPI002E2B61F8|nr:lipopolysaccharide kinase InaA family protein [Halomonas azerica]
MFTAAYWQRLGQITGEAPGRGNSLFIQPNPGGHQEWVLRRYLRGGLMAKLNRDQYLWTGRERTRAFTEMRLNAHFLNSVCPYRAR